MNYVVWLLIGLGIGYALRFAWRALRRTASPQQPLTQEDAKLLLEALAVVKAKRAEDDAEPYFPVPFQLEDLPEELQAVVKPAIPNTLKARPAMLAIEAYWDAGGARTPAVLLAYAYVRFTQACEIMVDEQLEESARALELIRESLSAGGEVTRTLEEFEAVVEEVHAEVKERRAYLLELAGADLESLDIDEVTAVAYELMNVGEPSRAIPFLERAIRESPHPVHYKSSLASCYKESGQIDEAQRLYRELYETRDEHNNGFVAGCAYHELILAADDADEIVRLFDEARAWFDGRNYGYPHVHAHQDDLLQIAMDRDLRALGRTIIGLIEASRSDELRADERARLEAARQQFG